jgi:hypothetical protein
MSSSASTPEKAKNVNTLVPCRGCVVDCIYISKCEGKPWRMAETTVLTLVKQSKAVSEPY